MATWYRAGTAAVTNGSAAVVGTTTAWASQVKAGDGITFDAGGTWYEVLSVTDNTHLTLASNYAGTTASGVSYAADRRSPRWHEIGDVSVRVAQLLDSFDATTGAYLLKASNLSDLASVPTARTNLGLGALALLSSVTASQISDASANGRSLISAANYAAMKTLLAIAQSDVSGLTSALAAKQDLDSDLTAIAGLTRAKGSLIAGGSSAWEALGVGTDGYVLTADAASGPGVKWAVATAAGINQSLLINGDFQINQRVFGGGSLSAGVYGFDRWKADTGGANFSVSGFVVTLTSGTIVQVIESPLWCVTDLSSTAVTISVEDPSADLTVTLGSVSGTITAGSGRRSVTLTTGGGDTGNLSLKIAKSSAGTVTFGRVKAEIGSVATSWQPRPLAVDERLAMRYYCKNFAAANPPIDNAAVGSDGQPYAAFAVAATSVTGQRIAFPVRMRATPTVTLYRPNGSTYGVSTDGVWAYYTGSVWTAASLTTAAFLNSDGFMPGNTVSGMTAGYGTFIKGGWAASAEL